MKVTVTDIEPGVSSFGVGFFGQIKGAFSDHGGPAGLVVSMFNYFSILLHILNCCPVCQIGFVLFCFNMCQGKDPKKTVKVEKTVTPTFTFDQ